MVQATTISEPPIAQARDASPESQASLENVETRASVDRSVTEDWATPATQREPLQQQSIINPQTLVVDQLSTNSQAAGDILDTQAIEMMPTNTALPQQSLYPLDGIEGEFNMDDADAWLANLATNDANDWLHDTVETTGSPPTSLATDTRTAQGNIWKGCRCPSHQEIYRDWPARDAELTIAKCMKICVYCGSDFVIAAELRKHLKGVKYARRNLTINQEIRGKYSSTTPAWTPRHPTESSIYRSDSEPLVR